MPYLSHLTSSTPTKSNLYLANSLAAAVSEHALYSVLTFQVPNLVSLFHCLRSYQRIIPGPRHVFMFRNYKSLYGEELLAPHPTPKKEDDPLSAVRDCLYHIFAAILHIGGRSSIRNTKTCYAVVTGTHLPWLVHIHSVYSYIDFGKRKKCLCLDHTITTSVT